MIHKTGKVIIEQGNVTVTEFAFEKLPVYPPPAQDILQRAAIEAMNWAIERLQTEKAKLEKDMNERRGKAA